MKKISSNGLVDLINNQNNNISSLTILPLHNIPCPNALTATITNITKYKS
jgi:hypothetical protein